jgi:hypothetical protein
MAKHLANDDRMWGHYDAVGHGHENARLMPRRAVGMIGDYEELVPNVQSLGGLGDFPLPSIGMPVVRNHLYYADPVVGQSMLLALRATVFQPMTAKEANAGSFAAGSQLTQFGTVTPGVPSGGMSWAEQAIQKGGAVLVELAPKDPLKPLFIQTMDPSAVVDAAYDKGPRPMVILGIGQAMQGLIDRLAPGPTPPDEPKDEDGFSTNAKIAIGVGAVAVIGIFLYASRK